MTLKMILIGLLAVASLEAAVAAEFKSGEVIVKYKDVVRNRTEMNLLYKDVGVKNIRRYSGIMKGFEQLTLEDHVSVPEAIAQLGRNQNVEYAQPNYIMHVLPIKQRFVAKAGGVPCIPGMNIPGCDPKAGQPCLMPGVPFPPGCKDDPGTTPTDPDPTNPTPQPSDPGTSRPALKDAPAEVNPPVVDPSLSKAYGLAAIKATEAWAKNKGSKAFIVADIDTGIDYNHEDLAFNVWRNPKPSDAKDIVGYDFVHNDGLPFDDQAHGTHTAGTIGAVGGNGIGISGVMQRVSLMAVKFLSSEGSGTTADAIRAIDYAVAHGAKVLSNSWGGKGDDGNQALSDAIDRAKAKDVLFIAAAGNDGADNDNSSEASYPAALGNDNIIAVAATDINDDLAFFSNYGKKTTHVAAPGANVYSTLPGNKYGAESGTSMACPHVAGAVGLLWSAHPDWNYKKVKQVLMDSVDQLPGLTNKLISGGRVNLVKALSVEK